MVAIAAIFCLALNLSAQLASTTALVGTVTDSTGSPVAGATVTALNEGTREVNTTKTNNEGYYEFQFAKTGTYTITAEAAGFEVLSKTGIAVATNQTARTDFTLKVGQVSEKVVVSADAPPIATDDPSLTEVIDTKRTADLPVNGRDSLRLAITTPGVIPGLKPPSGNPGGGEGFIGAGTREIQNSVSLDGVSIMNNLITTTTFRPTVDAVQELQVQTGTYPAQYGGYMGVQLNVITKSGTNDFHGSAFEFLRNDKLDAKNFFELANAPRAPLRQNQFGFSFGGPVWIPKVYNGKNRTFFLASYEGLRITQGIPAISTALTPLMRQGNFSEVASSNPIKDPLAPGMPVFPGNIIPASRLSSQAVNALAYMPLPTQPGVRNNFNTNAAYRNNTNQTIDRVDQSIGEKVRLFFRYAWENTTLLNGNANPNNGYNQPVTDRNFVVGYTQVLTPTAVNDLRFGRQHTTIDSINFFTTPALANAGTLIGIPGFTTDLANPGLPNLGITGFMSIGGDNMASSNWFQTDTTWQGTDVFNFRMGTHSFAGGAEIRKLITKRTANNNPRGGFTFSGTITGYAPADFMLGLPLQVITPGPLVPGGGQQWRDGFFFQDNWQASPKLTLILGLRYELPTVPHSTNGNGTILNPQQTAFIPSTVPQIIPFTNPTHKNWAPRVGFAYRATRNWVLRGGFGIYYNPNQLNTYTLATTNPPFSTIFTFNASPSNPILSLANPTPPGAQATAKPNAFTINPNLPTQRMNQWSFSVERALWRNAGMDIQYLGSHSYHLDRSFFNNTPFPGPGDIDARRPNQLFRVIRTIQNDMVANYEGLNVILRQQFTHGLSMLLTYTYSHTLDVTTDSNAGGAPMDPYNWRLDYGSSNWDLRHRFVASYVYELPFLKNSTNAFVRYAVANWQVNGITIIQSGFPFNVTVPGDPANTGVGNQRPNAVGTPSTNCGSGNLTNCISTSAFALPAQFTYGNFGRNVLVGPGLFNFDVSFFKIIPIKERVDLQIRGEFFNLFNHPAFSNPNSVFNTSTFGSVTSTSYNNRQVQVAARFTF
jgi:outer membrane receptor protein involved in Fe transport